MHFQKLSLCAVAATALFLGSCGTDPGDRAVSGGLLGAGTGAVIGSLAGSAGTGALIGGLGGAAIGGLSSPHAINLGEPIWRHHYSHSGRGRYVCHHTSEDEKVCHRVASR
jgi:osmotically inducible lipoprotein OsmB